MVMNIYAQETGMKSPYFKVLKSENIDFNNSYKYNDFTFVQNFKVGNDECKKVYFKNKYGIYNMTQNKWVVNIQFKSIDYIPDSLFRLKLNHSKVKLFHIDPLSKYNLEHEFEIEVAKDFVLFRSDGSNPFRTEHPRLFFPKTSVNKVLPYGHAFIINDTLIMVNNNIAFNIINSEGKLLFNKWYYNGIDFEDNEFLGKNLNFNHRLYTVLDYRTGEIKEPPNFKFNTFNFIKNKQEGNYSVFEKKMGETSLLIDTFYSIDEETIILSSKNKYYALRTNNFKNLADFIHDYEAGLCDSIKLLRGGLKIYSNNKIGLLTNRYNIDLSNPIHQDIFMIRTDNIFVYAIKKDHKITLYNENGNKIKECLCDKPFVVSSKKEKYYNDSVICFQSNGKIYMIDIFGNLHDKSLAWIKDELGNELNLDSIQGNEIIKIGEKFGVISKNKTIVIPFEYDYIHKTIFDGVYLVIERAFKDDYVFLVDTKGNRRVSYKGFIISHSSPSKKYFEAIGNDRKLLYFRVHFNPLSLVEVDYFEELSEFKSVLVSIDGKYGFESYDATNIIDFKYTNGHIVESKLLALKNSDKKYALFNLDGKRLTNFKFDTILSQSLNEIVAFANDTISIFKYNSDRSSIDVYKTLSAYKFSKRRSSFIEVKKNGRVGAIDFFGNIIIETENDWINRESSSYKYLLKRGNKFYFSPSSDTEVFKNGVDTAFFITYDHGVIFKIGTKYGLHRPNLQFTEALFDDIYEIHGDFLLVENDRKLGLYDIKRKTYILESEYNGIFYTDKNNITVIKGNLLQTVSINNQ
jgi:hypothetical protein